MTGTRRLFHLLTEAQWAAFTADPTWAPPSLAEEGFVHLSFAEQLPGTLETHFGSHARVWLAEVTLAPSDPALRVEPSRGGERFPHLYRRLTRAELTLVWLVERHDATWKLPELAPPLPDEPEGESPLHLFSERPSD